MKSYEMVYIFDPALERGAVDEKLESFHTTLGGEVAKIDHWGARQLAYPIQKSKSGYYVVVRVMARADALPEFERIVKLDRETLRYLVVSDDGLPTSGESILAPVHRPRDIAPESEGEVAPEDRAAKDAGQGAEGAAQQGGESDGATEEGAGEGSHADAEGAAEESTDAEERATDAAVEAKHESPRLQGRSGPPEYAGVRGRGRRRDGPPIVRLNYKDVATLSRFLNDQGKILPKRTTRVSARFQRRLGTAVKRARFLGLIPYVREHGS